MPHFVKRLSNVFCNIAEFSTVRFDVGKSKVLTKYGSPNVGDQFSKDEASTAI